MLMKSDQNQLKNPYKRALDAGKFAMKNKITASNKEFQIPGIKTSKKSERIESKFSSERVNPIVIQMVEKFFKSAGDPSLK